MIYVPFSQGTLDFSKNQNTTSKSKRFCRGRWRNLSINQSLYFDQAGKLKLCRGNVKEK